jgi:formylglycine-generating enzyme required for sulfatase activity
MRSWFTAMPGERLSCVGCHESQNGAPPPMTTAIQGRPHRIEPWRGPGRGFDFLREVQPVLDRYCVGCHDGTHKERPDFARKSEAEQRRISQEYQQATETAISTVFTPAFVALHPYVRRPHAESNHSPKAAAEYFADTSMLVQMLMKGHHNVRLDDEAWQRLYAWIDLGAPDHGSWHNSVWGSPENCHQRRLEMLRQFADRTDDVEWMPPPAKDIPAFTAPPTETAAPAAPACPGWPFDAAEARRRQRAVGLPVTLRVEVAKDLPLEFVLVPAGAFVLGDAQGAPDERRTSRVRIARPFYMSRCEITNAQFAALVDPLHDSGHADWLSIDWRGEGYPLTAANQPVVRVSQQEATAFCLALGKKLGRCIALPSEAEWEWACRAGSTAPLWYGDFNTDFSRLENLAGREQRELAFQAKPKWFLRDDRFDDRMLVSAPVGSFQPNPWGLCDMAGNVAEWTRTAYRADPDAAAGNVHDSSGDPQIERVVRGGSWRSRPTDATSARRWKYPAWRKVFDVGFRVVLEVDRP